MFEAFRSAFDKTEKNQEVLTIGVAFSVLQSEHRNEENLDDCIFVLTTCQGWVEELEVAGIDDKHELLESLRSYIQKYLPTYILAYNKKAEEQMEQSFNKE